LRTGGLILDHGLPHADPFSFTAHGAPWVGQSWLAELLYGVLERAVGPFGIRLLGAVVGAAIGVLTFRIALRLSRDRRRGALLSVAALGGLYTLWSERPLLLGVLFLLLLVWLVEVPDSPIARRPVLALSIVMWLWANVHGSFALGFAYLGLHLVGRWIDGHRPWEGRERQLLIGSGAAFAAIFVNPYGVSLVTFPIHLMARSDILRHVVEWASPDFHHVRGYAFALWIVVFVGVLARGPNRVSRRDLVVAVPFLLLACWALRNVAIAPLVGLPIVARAVAIDRPKREEARLGLGGVLAGVLVMLVVVIGVRAVSGPNFALDSYPVRAMTSVERQGLLGRRLLVDDANGGYLILRYGTRQPVFFDDRYDMYPRAVIEDYFKLANATTGWDHVLRKYNVEVVVWDRAHPLTALLRQSGEWTTTYCDRTYAVEVRSDLLHG